VFCGVPLLARTTNMIGSLTPTASEDLRYRFGYLSGSASHKRHQEMIILISEPITATLKTHSSRRDKHAPSL
jgi:hypothetical protein